MSDFKITGPRGGTVVKRAKLARVRRILPALVKRFGRVTVAPAPPDYRALVAGWARRGVQDEKNIHYGQVRPMPLNWTKTLTTDCSGFSTLCYKLAGAPDPNGRGYDGAGFTGTLLAHGRSVARAAALPGDLVFFGPGTAEHVAIVVEAGTDPLLVSHGQERGPLEIRLSLEKEGHSPPVRFRSYL